nr:hypothetical protein Iba_chr09cCG12160 [Ipomoea batatas]
MCLPVILPGCVGSLPVVVVGVRHQAVEWRDSLPQVVYLPVAMHSQYAHTRSLQIATHAFFFREQLECSSLEGCEASWHSDESGFTMKNRIGPPYILVVYAVVLSKTPLHSFKSSGNALAILFLISMCPIGSPRVATISSKVIWSVCPFWSCNVQLFESKFSTRHILILGGRLVVLRSRSQPSPMSFTLCHCAELSCSMALVSLIGRALIQRFESSSFPNVSSSPSVCSGLSSSSTRNDRAVLVRGCLSIDACPCSVVFLLLPA